MKLLVEALLYSIHDFCFCRGKNLCFKPLCLIIVFKIYFSNASLVVLRERVILILKIDFICRMIFIVNMNVFVVFIYLVLGLVMLFDFLFWLDKKVCWTHEEHAMNFSSFNWASVHLCFVIKITNLFDKNRKTGNMHSKKLKPFIRIY